MVRAMDELPTEAVPVTVTVTQPPPPQVELTGVQIAQLARELVMDVFPHTVIFGHFGITQAQFDAHIAPHPDFKRFFDQITAEWNSALSTPQRLKLQAAAYLEEALPKLAARMSAKTEDLGRANEVAKTLAKIAGIGEPNGAANPGEKFNITINLGGEKVEITKTIDAGTTSTEVPAASALFEITEGQGGAVPLQPFGEAQSSTVSIFDVPPGPPEQLAGE